jgi:hypothetical protein
MRSLQILPAFRLLANRHAHENSYGLGLKNVPNTTYEPIPLFHIPFDSLKNRGFIPKYLYDFPKHTGPFVHKDTLMSPVLCSTAAQLAVFHFNGFYYIHREQHTICCGCLSSLVLTRDPKEASLTVSTTHSLIQHKGRLQ